MGCTVVGILSYTIIAALDYQLYLVTLLVDSSCLWPATMFRCVAFST